MGFEAIPFSRSDEVLSYIPEIYSKNLQWFTTTPKFTTVRINTLKYNAENVAETIRKQLNEECLKFSYHCQLSSQQQQQQQRGGQQPQVFVHNKFQDCLVIGPWPTSSPLHNSTSGGEVIIDVPCGNAVLRGAHIFAPGVLALTNSVCVGDIVDVYVDIKGKCLRGYLKKFYGDKLYIASGIAKINRSALFANNAQVSGIAIEIIYRISNVPSITLEPDCGLLQNLPSIVCSYSLEPNCDLPVLDMCASPGNKTTHIAVLMNNQGRVIALDKSEQKVAKIISLANSFGLTNISAYVWDSTKLVQSDVGCRSTNEQSLSPPFCRESFSRILLDAPCSALGHRPNLYNKITLKQLKSYICLQRNLFHNAVELLKPGGLLVYSTCTITIEENEDLVKWALNKYSNLKLTKSEPYLGGPGLIESGLSDEGRSCVQRFDMAPGNSPDTDTIGFFIAKFIKDLV